jgi:hypothetical protein
MGLRDMDTPLWKGNITDLSEPVNLRLWNCLELCCPAEFFFWKSGRWVRVNRLAMTAVVMVMDSPSPPPIRIIPPGVIIIVGMRIGIVIV